MDELVDLYQRVSSHLSHARVAYDDPGLVRWLTRLVGQANGVVYARRTRTARAIADFFAWRFPAAVWQSGRFVAVSAALLLLPALAFGTWLGTSEEALEATASDAVREAYLNEDFEDYYSSEPASQFATEVTVNNIQVAVVAFAGGILLCVPTVASTGGERRAAGLRRRPVRRRRRAGKVLRADPAPRVAGADRHRDRGGGRAAAGLGRHRAGDLPRGRAVGQEARRAGVIALGLMLAFATAGTIEGFVTGRGVPTALRVGLGVAAEAVFVGWIVVQGRAAAARGVTGDLGELDRGWADLAAARERAWAG